MKLPFSIAALLVSTLLASCCLAERSDPKASLDRLALEQEGEAIQDSSKVTGQRNVKHETHDVQSFDSQPDKVSQQADNAEQVQPEQVDSCPKEATDSPCSNPVTNEQKVAEDLKESVDTSGDHADSSLKDKGVSDKQEDLTGAKLSPEKFQEETISVKPKEESQEQFTDKEASKESERPVEEESIKEKLNPEVNPPEKIQDGTVEGRETSESSKNLEKKEAESASHVAETLSNGIVSETSEKFSKEKDKAVVSEEKVSSKSEKNSEPGVQFFKEGEKENDAAENFQLKQSPKGSCEKVKEAVKDIPKKAQEMLKPKKKGLFQRIKGVLKGISSHVHEFFKKKL